MNFYSLLIGAALGVGGTAGTYELMSEKCDNVATKSISWSDAKNYTQAYSSSASPHLKNSDGSTIKGWYMEKCWIDELFAHYPQADGLQIYIGYDVANNSNNLVWLASAPWNNGGVMERQNLNDDGTVLDLSNPCPLTCPTKNDLP